MCRGKKGSPLDQEDFGIMKGNCNIANIYNDMLIAGFIKELYPQSQVSNEEFNTVMNSVCGGSRRRCKQNDRKTSWHY